METCRLLITFANSLDPDQDRQNVGPDLDPNCLCRTHFLKKISRRQGKHEQLPSMQRKEHLSGFSQRKFSSKKCVKTVTVSFIPSSLLDSLYRNTIFACFNWIVILYLFSKHYQSITQFGFRSCPTAYRTYSLWSRRQK